MTQTWTKVAAGTVLLLAPLLASACTGGPPEPTTAAPSPSSQIETPTPTPTTTPIPTPSATVDPRVAAAESEILAAYRGYWAAKVAALGDPLVDPPPELEIHAVDTALADVNSGVLQFRLNDLVMVGEPVLTPTVSDVVLEPLGTATITDCVDVANWQPMFRSTKESAAAPGQATRVLTNSTAYFYDGRWTIRTSVVDRATSC